MKKAGHPAFFNAVVVGLYQLVLLPRSESQLLSAFLSQGVSILVLQHTVEVQVRDALPDACLANTQIGIRFNSLPEVALEHGESNVCLLLLLVGLNDVEDHVIVLVHSD